MYHPLRTALPLLTFVHLLAQALSQPAPPTVGPLDALTRPSHSTSARESSAAPEPWSNRDNRWIKPGDSLTIADLKGPGIIRHIWFTFAEPAPSWISGQGAADHSEIVLRMYWDGAEQPAVESPLGDFFAAGFGRRAPVQSAPIIVQGGDSYNCYWPMPFFKSAKITLTNESDRPLAALYYQVDYSREDSLPADSLYFCAQYRQEFPTQLGHDYLIADIDASGNGGGGGQYVGTVMSVRSRSPEWFGEGDDLFYIDVDAKATTPTMRGTGTEDYFLNAWGMEKGCFPYNGVTQLDGWLGDLGNTGTMYRWHIPDAIHFKKTLRVEIEHAGWMSADETTTGKVEGFVEREDDFATVAFWYQQGQPKRFTTLPSAKDRKLPNLDRIIEGKDLLATATTIKAELSLQKGPPWTGDGQVFINAGGIGSAVEMKFTIPPDAKPYPHRAYVPITHSNDFGIYRVSLDGKPIGEAVEGKLTEGPVDFYSPAIELHDLLLSTSPLAAGEHTLKFECIGKNPQSTGVKLGVDSVRIRERSTHKRPPLGPPPK